MISILPKCLALVFSLLIFGQAYLIRRVVGTWLFPACLFGLFWFAYTFFPLIILFWVPAEPLAIGFILLASFAFSVSSLAFNWDKAFLSNQAKIKIHKSLYDSRFLKTCFYISTLGCVLTLILGLLTQAITIHDLVFNLQMSATKYANLIYSESIKDDIFDRLSIIFSFLGPALGGLIYLDNASRKNKSVILFLSFLPPVIVALTHTSKGLLFLTIVLFYAGVLVRRLSSGNLSLIGTGGVKITVISTIFIIPIVTVAFFLRSLYDLEDTETIISALKSYYFTYICGHLYAFSDWFSFAINGQSQIQYPQESISYGFYTFTSIFKLFGSQKITIFGVFREYYTYGDLLDTNIYTMFRGMILDFGIVGSIMFMAITGFLAHGAFRVMLVRKIPSFSVAVFVYMLAFFYNSFVISLLSYNRIYVAFFLLWLIIWLNGQVTQGKIIKFRFR